MGYQFNVFTGNFDLVNDDNDASYLTKSLADTYYYPLSTNPAGYLTAGSLPAQLWTESAGTLYPTTNTDRILLGGATDDGVSTLQLNSPTYTVTDPDGIGAGSQISGGVFNYIGNVFKFSIYAYKNVGTGKVFSVLNTPITFISTTGPITSVTLRAAGTGYSVGEILNVIQTGGSGGKVQVTSISGGGGTGPVTGISLNAGGTGYSLGINRVTTPFSGGAGTGCRVDITVKYNIGLTWDAVSGADGYRVAIIEDNTFDYANDHYIDTASNSITYDGTTGVVDTSPNLVPVFPTSPYTPNISGNGGFSFFGSEVQLLTRQFPFDNGGGVGSGVTTDYLLTSPANGPYVYSGGYSMSFGLGNATGVELTLINENSAAGAMFTNYGDNVVDFLFRTQDNTQQQIRFEERLGYTINAVTAPEWQFGPPNQGIQGNPYLFLSATYNGFCHPVTIQGDGNYLAWDGTSALQVNGGSGYAINATGAINTDQATTAPSTQTLLALPLNVFGAGTITDILGDPDNWITVYISGVAYKIPAYL